MKHVNKTEQFIFACNDINTDMQTFKSKLFECIKLAKTLSKKANKQYFNGEKLYTDDKNGYIRQAFPEHNSYMGLLNYLTEIENDLKASINISALKFRNLNKYI